MPLGFSWPWGKKEVPRPPSFSIKDIIWTTTRNRVGVYLDWGLGRDASEWIAQEVYDEYIAKWGDRKLTHSLIDDLQLIMHKVEMRHVETMKLWKEEYGL